MSRDGDEEPVGIARIDGHHGNLLPIAQAEMRPGRTGIDGLVDTVADGEIGTMQPFPAADVDDVGIGRCNDDCADGAGRLMIEDRIPGAPVVVGLPHPAVYRADVEDIRLARNAGEGARAAAAKRPDVAPVHFREHRRVDLLGGQ